MDLTTFIILYIICEECIMPELRKGKDRRRSLRLRIIAGRIG